MELCIFNIFFVFEPNKLYRFKDSFIAHCTYCSQTPIQVFIFFFPFFLFFLQLFMLFLPSFYSKFSKIFLLKEKIRKKHQFPQEIWRPACKHLMLMHSHQKYLKRNFWPEKMVSKVRVSREEWLWSRKNPANDFRNPMGD